MLNLIADEKEHISFLVLKFVDKDEHDLSLMLKFVDEETVLFFLMLDDVDVKLDCGTREYADSDSGRRRTHFFSNAKFVDKEEHDLSLMLKFVDEETALFV